jgi:hypothetical protein
MTSSARPRIDCGTARPSALAVLRLITSSNLASIKEKTDDLSQIVQPELTTARQRFWRGPDLAPIAGRHSWSGQEKLRQHQDTLLDAALHSAWRGRILRAKPVRSYHLTVQKSQQRTPAHASSSSSAFAYFRSGVSKPSVNQPYTGTEAAGLIATMPVGERRLSLITTRNSNPRVSFSCAMCGLAKSRATGSAPAVTPVVRLEIPSIALCLFKLATRYPAVGFM